MPSNATVILVERAGHGGTPCATVNTRARAEVRIDAPPISEITLWQTPIVTNAAARRLARQPTWVHDPILMADEKSLWTGLKRGLARRCPNCGKGQLLRGYLTIRSPCEVCGNDNLAYPSDDFPPYLTVFVAGHVIVALFVWTDNVYEPPLWVEFAIWLPVTVLLCLALLPFMKGAAVGLCWAMNIVRQESAT